MARFVVALAIISVMVAVAASAEAPAKVVVADAATPPADVAPKKKMCGRGHKGTIYGKLYQVGELAAQARSERQKKINIITKSTSAGRATDVLMMLGAQATVAVDYVSSLIGIDLEKDLGITLFSDNSQKSSKRLSMLQAADRAALFPSARVVVHSTCGCPVPVATTITAFDGTFELTNIPMGDYAVSVEGLDQFVFPSYRLEVSQEGGSEEDESVPSYVYTTLSINDGVPQRLQGGRTAKDPVVLRHLGRAEYFVPREEINPMSFLANPMVLMMLFSFVMMGMMKMVPKEEMKAQAKEMSQALEDGKKILGSVNKK